MKSKSGWKAWITKKKKEDPWYWARINLTRRYGITLEELNQMIRESKGKCNICQEKPRQGRLHVDHDHNTGKVRGLLCRSCNYALGAFDDSKEGITRALNYLRRAERKS